MGDVESHLSMFHFKCAVYDRLARKEELSSCISRLCVCVCVRHTLLYVCVCYANWHLHRFKLATIRIVFASFGISVPWGTNCHNGKLHLQLVPCVLRAQALTHPLVNIYPQVWLLTRL